MSEVFVEVRCFKMIDMEQFDLISFFCLFCFSFQFKKSFKLSDPVWDRANF